MQECPYLAQCTGSRGHVKIVTRRIWEAYMEMCEEIRQTLGMKGLYSLRKEAIERIFGSAKEKHGFRCGGNFSTMNYQFTKMSIGCLVVGLGSGMPSIIYEKENLPMPVKVIVHMGIGCAVYTITAYAVGWIGNTGSIGQGT